MAQEAADTTLVARVVRLEEQVTALQQQMAEALRQVELQTEQKLKAIAREVIAERAEHEDF
jgi:hypothetical protein